MTHYGNICVTLCSTVCFFLHLLLCQVMRIETLLAEYSVYVCVYACTHVLLSRHLCETLCLIIYVAGTLFNCQRKMPRKGGALTSGLHEITILTRKIKRCKMDNSISTRESCLSIVKPAREDLPGDRKSKLDLEE